MIPNNKIANVALAGCGELAQSVHLKILANMRGIRLTAIAETDTSRRHAASRLVPHAHAVADYQALLSRDDVDAVVLTLPTDQHADAAIAALQAGKHVYLEKPLATSVQRGDAVLKTWQASGGLIGMIGFNYRFNALYRRAREVIRSGKLGDPVAVRSVFATAARPLPSWKTRRAMGGGVLLDLASHHVDLMRFLFDTDVVQSSCDIRSRRTEGDTAFLQLALANGATAQSFFSLSAVDEDQFEIYGTAGKLTIDRCHAMDVQLRRSASRAHRRDQIRHLAGSLRRLGYGLARRRAFGHEPSWRLALEHFASAVRNGHPAVPDFADGYKSLQAVMEAEAAYDVCHPITSGHVRDHGHPRRVPDAAAHVEVPAGPDSRRSAGNHHRGAVERKVGLESGSAEGLSRVSGD